MDHAESADVHGRPGTPGGLRHASLQSRVDWKFTGPRPRRRPDVHQPGLHQPETQDLFTFQDALAQNHFREKIVGPGDAARRHEVRRQ